MLGAGAGTVLMLGAQVLELSSCWAQVLHLSALETVLMLGAGAGTVLMLGAQVLHLSALETVLMLGAQVLEVRHGAVVGVAELLPALQEAGLALPQELQAKVSASVCARVRASVSASARGL